MINISFNKRIFSDFFKATNFILVHKKGEKLDSRLISLLSTIAKLYEKRNTYLINSLAQE